MRPAPPPPRTAAPWLGVAALVLAGASVFWAFDALPFQDLPAHGGIVALRHRIAGALPGSAFDRRFYVYAPHIGPYSLFRFLGDVLRAPLGPVGAVRAIATLPIVATPAAVAWSRRALHGDRTPAAAYLAIALGFGFMTILGFASYLLGVAALVAGLTIWLKLLVAADRPDRAREARRWELAAAVAAPLLFVAHGHAFVIFLALAGVSALATGDRRRRIVRLRALSPALAFAAWVAWQERASVVPAGSVAVPRAAFKLHFQGLADKLSLLFTPTLMTRTGVDVAVGVFVWGVVGAAVFATARSLRPRPGAPPAAADDESRAHCRALLASIAALAIAFLALPHSIGWFGSVDGRLVPLLLLLGLMAIRREALGGALRATLDRGAPAAAAAMVAIALGASYMFQGEAAGWREVLRDVPAEARVLNLPLDPDSAWFTAHPFVHYDKLIMAERPVVVSDVWFHQGTGIFPTADNPSLRLPAGYSESDLRAIDWPTYRLRDWDYALVRVRPGAAAPTTPPALALVDHRGGWWLFRISPD